MNCFYFVISLLTCLNSAFLPKNDIVVLPTTVTFPGPAQSNIDNPNVAVLGISLNCNGSVIHSFQLKYTDFNFKHI